MCRHFAWLGAPRSLGALMLEPEHGLLVQSYRPRRQRNGLMNADGWGVGFYSPDRAEPARWRSNRPLWSDASFASVAPRISSTCVLGAVRSATPGMPMDETAVAPFSAGRWLLSHNGVLERSLLALHPTAESVCDSALLAAHVFDRGPEGVGRFVAEIGARDRTARLNVLLADGHQLLATRWNDSLSVLVSDDGVLVASEPFDDDPGWVDVPDHHLVDVTSAGMTITDLEN
jgi:gamma-glutamyl hercynylcysteine S-oxide hydrolase